MNPLTKTVKNSYFIVICLIGLLIQNIVIFFQHYFNNFGFRWDFDKSYYALPAFWTTAINSGIFPQWIPYQNMGFPLFMKAQSAFYYPFYWVFPLFSIPYTLQIAVYFQIFHVLIGSIGMFFFLNHMFKSPKYAIIGAFAFQFFGGFFANSQHVDIVRGFALLPWLFFVFTLDMDKPNITKKTLLIPIIIFLITTGAYPGIFISTIFMMSLFVILQSLNVFSKGFGKRKSFTIGGSLFGLLLLGIALSVIHLGPLIEFGPDEFGRFTDRSNLRYFVLNSEQFPGFFMSNTSIPGELSMTSTFITLPILIFASFITWNFMKKYWIFFVIFVVGILMSLGNQTLFWSSLTSLIPILELSRFPVSDYRFFITLPLLVFAILGLKSIFEKQVNIRYFIFRSAFIVSWFTIGIILLQYNFSKAKPFFADIDVMNEQIIFSIIIFITCISLLTIYLIKLKGFNFKQKEISIITVAIIALIILADGFLVYTDTFSWTIQPYDARWNKAGIPLEQDGKLITYNIFENIPDTRPEREITERLKFLAWKGYLTGDYMMQDSGRFEIKTRTVVESNKIYMDYMLMKWTPIFLDSPINSEKNIIVLDDKIFSEMDSNNESPVIQTRYGINDINYKVSLDEPKLMVENESYFKGWTATLYFPDREEKLKAIEVNDAFRGWNLPAGDYEMKANFQFPNYITFQMISLIALGIWIIVLSIHILRTKAGATVYNKSNS